MRGWDEWAAQVDDAVGLGLTLLLLVLAAGIVAALWYLFPKWLPSRWWRWPSRAKGARRWSWGWLRWPWPWHWRWPWRRRRDQKSTVESTAEDPSTMDSDELPDLPAEVFRSLADRLAAEGRYAEAVRERLRAIVRELIDTGLIDNRPGWTVTELAGAASRARPPVRPPLDAAARIFSDIWYGQRPAGRSHDEQMRGHAEAVHAVLATAVPAGPSTPAQPFAGGPLVGSQR